MPFIENIGLGAQQWIKLSKIRICLEDYRIDGRKEYILKEINNFIQFASTCTAFDIAFNPVIFYTRTKKGYNYP